MEDIKKLLERNEDYLMVGSDGENSDNESLSVWIIREHNDVSFAKDSLLEIKKSSATSSKKRNGEERLPTRRPNPNVYNRNALLARENRRKKKVYLEAIEKELEAARKVNRALLKALKRQMKISRRLEEEKKYFEGLIANRSEILSLVNALDFRRMPESELEKYISDSPIKTSCSTGCNDVDSLSIPFDIMTDDLENGTGSSLPTTSWDDVWNDYGYHIDNLILPESFNADTLNYMQSVKDDHCYVATTDSKNNQALGKEINCSDYVDVEGNCLHIVDELSNIYCSECNVNITSRTLPTELLN